MRIERWRNGREVQKETIDNVQAIVLLLHNEKGTYWFIKGPARIVHEIFIEGSVRWPSRSPWKEETAMAITDALRAHASATDEEIFFISPELVTGEYIDRIFPGDENLLIVQIGLKNVPPALVIININDSLLSIRTGERTLVGTNGWGSEKTQLMFWGAAVLFGDEAAFELQEVVYGIKAIESPDGREDEVDVDVSDIMNNIVRAYRAHHAGSDELILAAEAWTKRAEKQACENPSAPSLN